MLCFLPREAQDSADRVLDSADDDVASNGGGVTGRTSKGSEVSLFAKEHQGTSTELKKSTPKGSGM